MDCRDNVGPIGVFLLVAALGVLLTSGNLRVGDSSVVYSVAGNLLQKGTFEATPLAGHEEFVVRTGADGKVYCRFGLGHVLLGVPPWLAGSALATVWPGSAAVFDLPQIRFTTLDDVPAAVRDFTASLVNSFVMGLLAVGVLGLAGRLGLSRRAAVAAAVTAGIASPLFFLATDLTSEPASGAALVFAAVALARIESQAARGRASTTTAALAGAALGSAVLFKFAHGALLPAGALAFLLAVGWPSRRTLAAWAAFLGAIGACLAAIAAYNAVRFGSPLETGYTDAGNFTSSILEGAFGQLASPGRGLLVFFPVALAALVGAPALWRTSRAVAALTFGALLSLWALYSQWHGWEGGWTYGPRLLSPATALLALPAVMAARTLRSVPARFAAATAFALSFGMSLLGFAVDYEDYCFYLWRTHGERMLDVIRWSFADAPIAAYWTFPLRRQTLLEHALDPGFPWPLHVVLAVALTAFVVAVVLLTRAIRAPDDGTAPGRRPGSAG